MEWKDGSQTYNPISDLFDIEIIQKTEKYSNYPWYVRLQFAECAKKAIAMVAIDVANLKWMVHAIKTNPLDCHMIEIKESIFMPLCALSMIPQIREHCTEDILIVLAEVKKYADPELYSYLNMEDYNPSLFTLYKMLEDGPIRRKVDEIVAIVCRYSYLDARMLLGDYHPLVRSTEKSFSDAERSSRETLLNCQGDCHRKVYAIGNRCIYGYENSRLNPYNAGFIRIHLHTVTILSAIIEQDNTLKWEGTTPTLVEKICFSNDPSPPLEQVRLFIINQLPTPGTFQFWNDITSCTSILKFRELMTQAAIRQIILTYGITILESSSLYEISPV